MELFSDPVTLARIQFAATALYHYLFVPLSIGFGLVLAVLMTKAYRTKDPKDEALSRFWLKVFAVTFAVGVATGITMEFSFGTNWADYSRFVGDIFGAPLAAEALFAFFMESVFLGILLCGRNRVSAFFYTASAWVVWFGSCLSALWIIIANSWMQTPAGYEVVGEGAEAHAVMTDFFAAAFNYSTLERYFHVIVALLMVGALFAIAVGAYYKLKDRNAESVQTLLKVGLVIGVITGVLMLPAAHGQAVVVADYQPSKLAAMEGQWEAGASDLSLIGWVDEETQTTVGIMIPGGTSFLATWDFATEYPGINNFAFDEQCQYVNFVYQAYHLMVALYGLYWLFLLLGFLVFKGKLSNKVLLRIMSLSWIAPLLAIEAGWCVAEVGRQPWIVFGELKTADAISQVVDPVSLCITLLLFLVIYCFIYVLWGKAVIKTVKEGPEKYLPENQNAKEVQAR